MPKKDPAAETVPVDPLREYFCRGVERGDFTAADIARSLGWVCRPDGHREPNGDSTRVLRALGLKSHPFHGRPHVVTQLRYERAVALSRALGMDPVDAGV